MVGAYFSFQKSRVLSLLILSHPLHRFCAFYSPRDHNVSICAVFLCLPRDCSCPHLLFNSKFTFYYSHRIPYSSLRVISSVIPPVSCALWRWSPLNIGENSSKYPPGHLFFVVWGQGLLFVFSVQAVQISKVTDVSYESRELRTALSTSWELPCRPPLPPKGVYFTLESSLPHCFELCVKFSLIYNLKKTDLAQILSKTCWILVRLPYLEV